MKRVLAIAVLVPVVAALAVTGLTLGGSAQAASARSAASPSQTVVFDCLGQHALTDTGQCVARATSSAPMSPYSPPAALPPAARQEIAAAPLGSAPLPRALRAD